MKLLLNAFLLTGVAIAAENSPLDPAILRDSVQRGLGLLEKTSPQFIKRGGCNSCHNQFLPAAAQAMARDRGIPVGKEFAQLPVEAREEPPDRLAELIATGGANSIGYQMFVDAAVKRPADERSAALINYLFATQESDGRWQTAGNRPPMTYDDFNTTALSVFALREYAVGPQRADARVRMGRARTWFLKARPEATQERAFQLLGLAWTDARRESIDEWASSLIAQQRTDGGWAQLPGMQSDAYATGEALYALQESGARTASDPACQRAIRFLTQSQAKDGSWHVRTRSLPVQPYFESGFPYEHDQWISSAGTSWAAMALARAVEPVRVSSR
jgi:hypothetical protein